MTLVAFTPKPGIVKLASEYALEGRWTDGDHVRFNGGLPEKLAGWDAVVGGTYTGAGRGLLGWRANNGDAHVAIGTHKKLYVWNAGSITDITPLATSGTLTATDAVSTTSGSAIVNIEHSSHGRAVGDYVSFADSAAVGGITIDGEYEVTGDVDADNYEITHTSAASSTASGGGGATTFEYQISVGYEDNIPGYGYGVGGYGEEAYGTPRTSSITLGARIWHLDNFGEDLRALHRNGNLYAWDLSAGGRAALVAGAPTNGRAMFVSSDRKVHILGAGGAPMRDEWSDTADDSVWTAAADNDAGGKTLQGGSELMAGARGEGLNLVWSDEDLFVFIEVPTDLIYDARRVAGAGIIAPLAWTEINGTFFWMGQQRFLMFDGGGVRDVPNQQDIHSYVYGDPNKTGFPGLNRDQQIKFHCGGITAQREAWFFYCSATSDEIDRAVAYDLDDRCWTIHSITRTAFEQTLADANPLGLGTDSQMYVHETGFDDDDAALTWYIKSAPVDIGAGDQLMDVQGLIADFERQTEDITLRVYAREYPQAEEFLEDEVTIEPGATRIDLRAQGRQVALRFGCGGLGGNFRMGKNRLDVQPAGGRR